MRILYITGGFPYPLTSGFLRHYHFIKRLSQQHHQIVLVSKVGATFLKEHIAGVATFTERVIPIRHISSKDQKTVRRIVSRGLTLFRANPAILKMRAEIKCLLQNEHFDLIILSGEYNISAISGLETPPIVMDMCDAKSDRIRRRISSVNSLFWKVALQVKLWEMQSVERRIFQRSTCIVCASPRDQRIVPTEARERSFVIPNGVDTEYWRRQSNALGRHTLIFTGAMQFPPNNDAALYLINQILPGVRQEIRDAKLLIVGHSPGNKLVEAGKQPGVTVTGFVDDMRPYLEKATVFVSPLRFGSGIQNKVLEAMAMALPIVASSVAGDGVRVNGTEPPFLIADDTDTFIQYTIGLLQQADANPIPNYCAREYVETHFTWDRNVERLNEIIQAVK